MRNLAIRDESFDVRSTSSCHLSVQYGERFFSFAILDLRTSTYILLKNLWFPDPVSSENQAGHLRILLNADNYLLRSFHSVFFMYHTPLSVLVPNSLFITAEKRTYFKFAGQPAPDDLILENSLRSSEAIQLFPVPRTLLDFVTATFDHISFFHQSTPLIDLKLPEKATDRGHQHVFLHAGAGHVDLAITDHQQLVFYNNFKVKNPEDVLFFVLYLYDQFGLLQEDTPLELSGLIELYPGLPDMLLKYIRKVTLAEFSSSLNYSYTFDVLSQHQFTNLLNLYHCG